jgi:hypothetical protein
VAAQATTMNSPITPVMTARVTTSMRRAALAQVAEDVDLLQAVVSARPTHTDRLSV